GPVRRRAGHAGGQHGRRRGPARRNRAPGRGPLAPVRPLGLLRRGAMRRDGLRARGTLRSAELIPVWEPVLDGNEERYVRDCLETNWISSLGRYITRFEEAFAAWCGMPHGAPCSSGPASLHPSLVA